MKIRITPAKPRNPLATLARQRRAGSHRPAQASLRQSGRQAMQRALSELSWRSP